MQKLLSRLDVLENQTLQVWEADRLTPLALLAWPCSVSQARLESAAPKEKETLKSLEQKGKSAFSLAQHVIPLTQLKSRQDSFDVAMHVCQPHNPSLTLTDGRRPTARSMS